MRLIERPMWGWPFATPFFRAATATYVLALVLILCCCAIYMKSVADERVHLKGNSEDSPQELTSGSRR